MLLESAQCLLQQGAGQGQIHADAVGSVEGTAVHPDYAHAYAGTNQLFHGTIMGLQPFGAVQIEHVGTLRLGQLHAGEVLQDVIIRIIHVKLIRPFQKRENPIMHEDILSNLIITNTPYALTLPTSSMPYKHYLRPDWLIIYQFQGELICHTNQNTYYGNTNNILIQPKGCSYRWRCSNTGYFITIRLDSELTWNEILSFPIINSEKFLAAFQKIERLQTSLEPMHNIKIMQETYHLLQMLTDIEEPQYIHSSKQAQVLPAYKYIVTHYDQEIKNDYLAHLCDLSTAHFRKVFSEVYGTSPISYAQSLRMSKAKELLKSNFSSINDIALSLGYNNIFEFSKMFKKYHGISPTQFVKDWLCSSL